MSWQLPNELCRARVRSTLRCGPCVPIPTAYPPCWCRYTATQMVAQVLSMSLEGELLLVPDGAQIGQALWRCLLIAVSCCFLEAQAKGKLCMAPSCTGAPTPVLATDSPCHPPPPPPPPLTHMHTLGHAHNRHAGAPCKDLAPPWRVHLTGGHCTGHAGGSRSSGKANMHSSVDQPLPPHRHFCLLACQGIASWACCPIVTAISLPLSAHICSTWHPTWHAV